MINAKIVKNISWLVVERGVQIGIAIVISALIARRLGPEGLGQLQLSLSIVLVCASVTLIGNAYVTTPRLAETSIPELQNQVIRSAFQINITLAAVAYILATSYAGLVYGFTSLTFSLCCVLALTIFFREPFAIFSIWLQINLRNKISVIFGLAAIILKLAIVLFSIATHGTVLVYGLAWVVEALIIAILLWFYYFRQTGFIITLRSLNRELIRSIISSGLVSWVGLMAMYVFLRMDRLFLERFTDLQHLGIYAAAMQITENFVLICPILASSLAPNFIYREQSRQTIRRNTLLVTLLMTVIGLLGAITLSLIAPIIIPVVFGMRFQASTNILQKLALVSTLIFVETGLNLYLVKHRAFRWLTAKWVCALGIAFLADRLLIPIYQELGAVIGFGLGYFVTIVGDLLYIFMIDKDPE